MRTASGGTIVFSATTDYFTQLANLDLTLDRIAAQGATFKRINLANGRDVTVTLDTPLLPKTSVIGKSAPSPKAVAMPVGSKPSSPHTTAFGNFSTQPKKAP